MRTWVFIPAGDSLLFVCLVQFHLCSVFLLLSQCPEGFAAPISLACAVGDSAAFAVNAALMANQFSTPCEPFPCTLP